MSLSEVREAVRLKVGAYRKASVILLASVLAGVTPAASQAATIISFSGVGAGFSDPGGSLPFRDSVESSLTGDLSFDAALAMRFGSGLRFASTGFTFGFRQTLEAQVEGDTLFVRLIQASCNDSSFCTAPIFVQSSLDLVINFRQGFLANTFPIAASLADVDSAIYSAVTAGGGSRVERYGSRGSLTNLAISTRDGTVPFGSGFFFVSSGTVPAVPEPATWATMLLGFGAVGSTMRLARRQRLISLRGMRPA